MRIAIFGDIHANYHALEAVLADMERRGVDRAICLGDITLKGPAIGAARDVGMHGWELFAYTARTGRFPG